ncbi:hypothetical protein PSECIP111951_01882 [Pseudoalteromonas holothuriae]|uniref:Uncharacterized protein n=1 Tax=Pseudoalteromonas holothuriae TaxID=2963714 RepID=A0ABN8UNH3_9GAMM|nr:hypothetical protein [Pseudoalteromonas sp. CIP111951]CAH9058467.1 hypothetical protein PSECIP111951_01882 [Pseudoalteromonas sp. CIP111951]
MEESVKYFVVPIVSMAVAYFTTTWAFRRELRHGRFRMLELTRRYFLNFMNAFESGTIKTDQLSKEMYLSELEYVIESLQALSENPYYSVLIEKYEDISFLLVQLRREVLEHKNSSERFALNESSIKAFYGIYQILRKDMPKYTKTDVDNLIQKACEANGISH